MLYCQYCGKEIPEGGHFCQYCGKPITEPWKAHLQQPQIKLITKLSLPKEILHLAVVGFFIAFFLGLTGIFLYGLNNVANIDGGYVFPLSDKLLYISIACLGLVSFVFSIILLMGVSSKRLWNVLRSYWVLVIAFFLIIDLTNPNVTKQFVGGFILPPLFSAGCIFYGFDLRVKQHFSTKHRKQSYTQQSQTQQSFVCKVCGAQVTLGQENCANCGRTLEWGNKQ